MGTLELLIYQIDIEPTISALQVDDSHYQVTMLFPAVLNENRPTLFLDKCIAKQDYFELLWNFLRRKAGQPQPLQAFDKR